MQFFACFTETKLSASAAIGLFLFFTAFTSHGSSLCDLDYADDIPLIEMSHTGVQQLTCTGPN